MKVLPPSSSSLEEKMESSYLTSSKSGLSAGCSSRLSGFVAMMFQPTYKSKLA
jgi:hypothetical protein